MGTSIVSILGACVKPVGVETFLKDPKIEEIIESAKVAVRIDDKTGDGLKPRDRRIEGLKPDKYYMVEKELDENGISVPKYNQLDGYDYPLYVSDHTLAQIPGGLYPDLGVITRIKDGRINGLINFHTYTVRAAEPLPNGNLPYTDDGGTVEKPVTDGIINITSIRGTGSLDLSGVFTTGTYEVIAVSVDNPQSNSPWNWESKTADLTSFALEGPDTEVDYVFVKNDAPLDFKVLRVKIGPSISPVNVTLNIAFDVVDETPAFNPANFTFNQSNYYNGTPQSVTINVSNPGNYTIVEWKYDGKSPSLGTGLSITLSNTSDIDYFAEGTHIFTLLCTSTGDGKPYSADFTLTVGP